MPFANESRLCREAHASWETTPIQQRLAVVRRFRRLLVDTADELMAAVSSDVSRPADEVLGSDVLPLAAAAEFLEKNAKRLLAPRNVCRAPMFLFGQSDRVVHRPWGVAGIIGTWNYPILLNGVQLLQALVAGNGVMFKPSEYAGTSGSVLHRMLKEAGAPSGLLQLLPANREAGPQLIESEIDYLVFTGSAGVGKKIAVRLAERMIPSTLELSGCDAMFVFDDADLDLAVRAAWFGMTLNRGQTCLAVRRMFVQRGIAPQFVEKIKPLVESAKPMSLVTKGQIDQASQLITDAIARGGKVMQAATASSPGNNAMLPTLVFDATPDMELCQKDCFAPIAAVLPFDSREDALALDRRCPFGLGASIFSRAETAARELAANLRVGSVCINDVIAPTAHPATPFGGRGASGWGITQGAEGLLSMTTPQVISRRRGSWRPHFDGVTPATTRLLRGLLDRHSAKSRFSLRGFGSILSGMRSLGREAKVKSESQ